MGWIWKICSGGCLLYIGLVYIHLASRFLCGVCLLIFGKSFGSVLSVYGFCLSIFNKSFGGAFGSLGWRGRKDHPGFLRSFPSEMFVLSELTLGQISS